MKYIFIPTELVLVLLTACSEFSASPPHAPAVAPLPSVGELPVRAEMPDPLLDASGQKITTAAEWQQHRSEMKRVLEYYATGTMPPPPGNVKGVEIKSQTVNGGKARFRLVHLSFGPGKKLGFDIAIFTPTQTNGPFPTFVNIAFGPTPGVFPPTNNPVAAATNSSTNLPAARRRGPGFGSPDPDAAARRFAMVLERGYAVVTYNYTGAGDDNTNGRNTKIVAAYPGYDWGLEGAWAWSMSRVVDYLETQSFADKTRLIALGHSRLGKATLIAGAFDDRFALVAPAGSGCFGTGAYRFNGAGRGGKEGLEDFTKNFSYQVGPRLAQFAGHVNQLPFDQHWFIALVAPRPFISLEAIDDQFCNTNASRQSFLAAKPVYEFLGVPDKIAINYRPGTHSLAPADWQAALDFCDQQLPKH